MSKIDGPKIISQRNTEITSGVTLLGLGIIDEKRNGQPISSWVTDIKITDNNLRKLLIEAKNKGFYITDNKNGMSTRSNSLFLWDKDGNFIGDVKTFANDKWQTHLCEYLEISLGIKKPDLKDFSKMITISPNDEKDLKKMGFTLDKKTGVLTFPSDSRIPAINLFFNEPDEPKITTAEIKIEGRGYDGGIETYSGIYIALKDEDEVWTNIHIKPQSRSLLMEKWYRGNPRGSRELKY